MRQEAEMPNPLEPTRQDVEQLCGEANYVARMTPGSLLLLS